jgi:transcriptional regulator GlxA family with amidase domain
MPQVYLCNKIPLFDRKKEVIGIAGVKRPYDQIAHATSGHSRLLKVVQFVTAHFGEDINVADLAAKACLSPSQLHREFARLFGTTPNRYLREVRVGVARHLLEAGEQSMAQIARHCGFYDQSHFTRQFKTSTGLTPRQYQSSRPDQ